jgi:anti-anti-sigma regulatory factor
MAMISQNRAIEKLFYITGLDEIIILANNLDEALAKIKQHQ